MSYDPTAPPPSYDDLSENTIEDTASSPVETVHTSETLKSECEKQCEIPTSELLHETNSNEHLGHFQTNPYYYSEICLNTPCAAVVPVETQPPESQPIEIQPLKNEIESYEIKTQPIVVQPQVIHGTGLIANPDGTYDFGPYPCRVLCPECHKTSPTKIEYKNSIFTHLLASLLCCLGCCFVAPVPYCIDSCKNSVHYCGECGIYLGTYVNGYSVNRYRQYNKYGLRQHSDKIVGPHNCNEQCTPHCHFYKRH